MEALTENPGNDVLVWAVVNILLYEFSAHSLAAEERPRVREGFRLLDGSKQECIK